MRESEGLSVVFLRVCPSKTYNMVVAFWWEFMYIHNRMVIYADDEISRVFRALSDPTRRDILRLLAGDGRSVQELTSVFSISQPAITKHLNVLDGAGLVSRRKDGRFRRCALKPGSLNKAQAWIDQVKGFWEERVFALDELLYSEEE